MLDLSFILKKDCINIGLYGIGKSTLGAFDFLISKLRYKEIKVTLRWDEESVKKPLPKVLSDCTVRCGKDAVTNINEDILILSPSVRSDRRELVDASQRGVIITSDAEIFFSFCEGQVYGVSGSDGKSTTSRMAHLLLGADECGIGLCGNFGVAMSQMLLDKSKSVFVTELSSFMLNSFSPRVKRATVTNITPNHLNWHKSFEEYRQAKENLLINAEERALWAEGDESIRLVEKYEPGIIISTADSYEELRRKYSAKSYVTEDGAKILLNGDVICDTRKLSRLGRHTVKNFMNAIALTLGYAQAGEIQDVADSYSPLPHRCLSVGVIDGIEYIDSSIDSTPERAATTLLSLHRRVTLILCGKGKGLSYEPLISAIRLYADKIIIGGDIRDEAYSALLRGGIEKERLFTASGLQECVRLAKSVDTVGAVLLSPSATSYDEFNNFEERGIAFKNYVTKRK